jgi:hypothetical protein
MKMPIIVVLKYMCWRKFCGLFLNEKQQRFLFPDPFKLANHMVGMQPLLFTTPWAFT